MVFAALFASCQREAVAPSASSSKVAVASHELSGAARLSRANQRLELSAYKEAEADYRALLLDMVAGQAAPAGAGADTRAPRRPIPVSF